MPKGVEHNRSEQWKTIAMLSVESLMPKGVEHIELTSQAIDDPSLVSNL